MFSRLLIIIYSFLLFSTLLAQINISGSTTIQPLIEKIVLLYQKEKWLEINIAGGGSGKGLSNVLNGISDIGMVSRALKSEEKAQVKYQTIGYDALVFVVNERNPLDRITKQMLLQIYRGEKTNWADFVQGFNEPIVLVSKELGRATLELFEEYSGLHHPNRAQPGPNGYIAKNYYEVGSNLEAVTLVGAIPQAIGYISLGMALELKNKGLPIKILTLDSVIPSKETVLNKTYPILRELNLVFVDLNEQTRDFLDYVLSDKGQEIVKQMEFIPIKGE